MRTELARAEINYKRAKTRHEHEQEAGRYDGSVRQTRRMAFAAMAFQRAGWRFARAKEDAANFRFRSFAQTREY